MPDGIIVGIIGFLAGLMTLITPIVKLNGTIERLNVTLNELKETTKMNHADLSARVNEHGKEIDDLAIRVAKVEAKIEGGSNG